tara:strand:- start:597 stop:908 length:312 start_codon:yes stop_codon:yes gene_type:complete
MKIADFINNWLRPEVKFLIIQYTLYSPIKSELNELFRKRKNIQYKWIRFEYSWRLKSPIPMYCLYIDDSNKKERILLLEEEVNEWTRHKVVFVSNTKLLFNNQ